jgi:hypothetical protein
MHYIESRYRAAAARVPVVAIDLPQTDVHGSIGILIHSIGIAAGFSIQNADAAGLIPA